MHTTWEKTRELQPDDYESRLTDLLVRAQFDQPLIEPARAAINGYSNELPYHNIEHMFLVAEETLSLCEHYELPIVDTQVLVMAALWHDCDYKMPLESQYESKEQRSAIKAYEAIISKTDTSNYEQIEFVAESVASLIISTHESHTPSNLAEAILNSSDLINLQGPSLQILLNTIALYIESRLLAGEQIVGSVSEYIESQSIALSDYCQTSQTFLRKLVTTKFGTTSLFEFLKTQLDQITISNLLAALSKNDDQDLIT